MAILFIANVIKDLFIKRQRFLFEYYLTCISDINKYKLKFLLLIYRYCGKSVLLKCPGIEENHKIDNNPEINLVIQYYKYYSVYITILKGISSL
jgi:hypothetical protein